MRHPDDGALLRYMDGETLAGEQAHVSQHVPTCEECTTRQKEIRDTLDTVAYALRRTDSQPRGLRPTSMRWPVAIAAGVLLALTLGVAPVRAWIVRLPKVLWETITPSEVTVPAMPDTSRVVESDEASVSFVPGASVFLVQVVNTQAEGSLTIEFVDGDTATATLIGARGAEELIVLPAGFRILNARSSIATYVVRVPARLEKVRVSVAGDSASLLETSSGRRRWVVQLGAR